MKTIKLLLTSVVLVALLSGCSLLYPNMGKPTDGPSPTKTETESPNPTPTETKTETPKPTKSAASVEIMDAYVDEANGIIQVVAQITNFSEDGGTCTVTFSGGGKETSVSGMAESNAANTQCRPLEIALGGIPSGSGVVKVTYESTKHYGVSESTGVVIP